MVQHFRNIQNIPLSNYNIFRCPILLSYEVRDDFEDKRVVKERFFELVKRSFTVKEFQTSECHPEYAADDIKVIRLDPLSLWNQ